MLSHYQMKEIPYFKNIRKNEWQSGTGNTILDRFRN